MKTLRDYEDKEKRVVRSGPSYASAGNRPGRSLKKTNIARRGIDMMSKGMREMKCGVIMSCASERVCGWNIRFDDTGGYEPQSCRAVKEQVICSRDLQNRKPFS